MKRMAGIGRKREEGSQKDRDLMIETKKKQSEIQNEEVFSNPKQIMIFFPQSCLVVGLRNDESWHNQPLNVVIHIRDC